jgi:hypothetical protein
MSTDPSMAMLDRKSPPARAFAYSELHAQIAALLQKDLLFVGGHPKSGTTWLQVMLNAHPEISCKGEGHFIDHFAPLLTTALETHNKLVSLKNTTIFREFAPFPCFDRDHSNYLLLSAMALALLRSNDRPGVRVIGEKTPNNLLYFPHLDLLFPNAKFLHVVRDGRDCLVSTLFHNLRTNPTEQQRRYPSFEGFAEFVAGSWKTWVGGGMRFGESRPDRCMIVRYEDLSLHPRDTMRGVLRFLGVDSTLGVVRHCIAEGAFEKMSGGRRPGVEDRSSFLRRGVPGNWRDHLTAEGNRKFLAIAGELMTRLGYSG